MFRIWNASEMETVASHVNKEYIINFAETIIDDKIEQKKAGVSRFNKAVQVLANHDFELYKTINNEKVEVN